MSRAIPLDLYDGVAGASLNGLGYFFSEEKGSYRYNPQTNSWSPVSFFETRAFGTAFTLNAKIYFAAGGSGEYNLSNELWEFTPENP